MDGSNLGQQISIRKMNGSDLGQQISNWKMNGSNSKLSK
jgi:hypothetical protein